jgi:3-hydroxyisobutyrate dehydrogenase
MTATQPAQSADRGLATETVAVLGAGGTMGLPIARNIARAGLPVRAWNRSAAKAKPLADDGAYLAATPADAAAGAGIVITIRLSPRVPPNPIADRITPCGCR